MGHVHLPAANVGKGHPMDCSGFENCSATGETASVQLLLAATLRPRSESDGPEAAAVDTMADAPIMKAVNDGICAGGVFAGVLMETNNDHHAAAAAGDAFALF